MKKLTNKGFGAVEWLLVVVVVTLLGVGAWYVIDRNSEDETTTADTTTQEANDTETNIPDEGTEQTDENDTQPTKDSDEYTNDEYGFSLTSPTGWTVDDTETTYNGSYFLRLTSPDYQAVETGIGGQTTGQGGIITLIVESTDDTSLEDKDRTGGPLADRWANEDYTVADIDGVLSWEYEFEYEGDAAINVEVVHNGFRYTFGFNGETADEKEAELISSFVELLQSVNFVN